MYLLHQPLSGAPILLHEKKCYSSRHRHSSSIIFEDEVFMLDIVTYLIVTYLTKYEYKYKMLISLLEIFKVF